ncbi:MAG: hypothetical protein AAF225_06780 [Pseudomonadota bacterium]
MSLTLSKRVDAPWSHGWITPREPAHAIEQAGTGKIVKTENQPFVDTFDAEVDHVAEELGGSKRRV